MIIIGIDPGTLVTGYGIIKCQHSSFEVIDFGCIKPPARFKITDRYLIIFENIEMLLDKHKPVSLAVETQYVDKNPQSAIKLGMARGIVIIAAKRKGIVVYEYSPCKAKKAVTGNGRATKQEVQQRVKTHLGLKNIPEPEDAADALALALCHGHTCRLALPLDAQI